MDTGMVPWGAATHATWWAPAMVSAVSLLVAAVAVGAPGLSELKKVATVDGKRFNEMVGAAAARPSPPRSLPGIPHPLPRTPSLPL